MRAIVIKQYGGPDVLAIEERPDPKPEAGQVVIEVKAFGINHAETHMREGNWPEIAEISGIECAGLVKADPSGRLSPGEKVVAFMGGMGRSIAGSYAEFTRVPIGNVMPIKTDLAWEDLARYPGILRDRVDVPSRQPRPARRPGDRDPWGDLGARASGGEHRRSCRCPCHRDHTQCQALRGTGGDRRQRRADRDT